MIIIINPVAFELFNLKIRWYGIIIAAALLISLFVLKLILKDVKKLDFDFYLDYIILAFPLAILGARFYYVIFNLPYYLSNPVEIIAIYHGGLAIHGGLLVGILVLYFWARHRAVNFWQALDFLAPAVALAQALGRWGNFINQEAYGRVVRADFFVMLPEFIKKQMFINGYYREPTFLYESILDLLLFLILIIYRQNSKRASGDLAAIYLAGYSGYRFFIEDLRTDSLVIADFQIARIISVLLFIFALIVLLKNHISTANN
ncbi:prolipoprotein diacylglyceryl transferase [Halanaerobium salsuginis]|uniref:Phosphatidylglycerol--prolipoprotein diacylglyceryl transferase n=1 Tax=Halanaerobium salsuginis TaxID=29563 RepID=A0A1I4GGR3_9FIRM|nr:prolipoprotein diacylglyceryl transferase [Halanaerobium salsuginis]SFL29252.1 phosphatidylglycerol:prolipoprotein diacylglycerol transferase [Halanaerobium salsuginis]